VDDEVVNRDRHRHRPADEGRPPQVEPAQDLVEVVGVAAQGVAVRRLARIAGAAQVERDDPVVACEVIQLASPEAGRDRPARNEDDRRPAPRSS
jgi:hypothetical protein